MLDLLGEARRAALPPLQRLTFDLEGIIEEATKIQGQPSTVAEPTSLGVARRRFADAASQARRVEIERDGITQRLSELPPLPAWRRAFGGAGDVKRDALLARLDGAERLLSRAHIARTVAQQALDREAAKFKAANSRYQAGLARRRAEAELRIATARVARKLVEKHPPFAWWSLNAFLRVATEVRSTRAEAELDDWDLVGAVDLWGVAYQRRPKAF